MAKSMPVLSNFWMGCFKRTFSICVCWRSAKSCPHLKSPVKNTSKHNTLISVVWLLLMFQLILHTNQDASSQHPTHHTATAGPESLSLAAGCCKLHWCWEAHLLAEPMKNSHRGYNVCFCIVRVLPLSWVLGAWTFIDDALCWTGAEEMSSTKYQMTKERGTSKVNGDLKCLLTSDNMQSYEASL